MIDYIFRAILPDYGMAERPVQIKLSHEMLEAMLGGKIALCDAGTGIGKTYAYLVAGAVADRCRGTKPFQPILISTSSIALQGAVLEEYLPKLSHRRASKRKIPAGSGDVGANGEAVVGKTGPAQGGDRSVGGIPSLVGPDDPIYAHRAAASGAASSKPRPETDGHPCFCGGLVQPE